MKKVLTFGCIAAMLAAPLFAQSTADAQYVFPADPGKSISLTPRSNQYGAMYDFGEPQVGRISAKLSGRLKRFHYVQIGDSHTAASFMTDVINAALQQKLGHGGLGWAPALDVPGQRSPVNITAEGTSWRLVSSRNERGYDFPFGGQIAAINTLPAKLNIALWDDAPPLRQNVIMLLRQTAANQPLHIRDAENREFTIHVTPDNQWRPATFTAQLPFTVTATAGTTAQIGGWWFKSPKLGALATAAGINGARLSQWSNWRAQWMDDLKLGQPDVVAIAFGTNEAVDPYTHIPTVRSQLIGAISSLRQAMPETAILIIGAPEILSSQDGTCGTRAPSLDAIQSVQREVAQQMRTLYWDWQQAMGGPCTMNTWVRTGLAQADAIHFTVSGYQVFGTSIYTGLNSLQK